MANMFYSLQDVIKKFNKTENEIKELVKAGKLREFRDGANLLFKVDEVDAMLKPANEPDLEQLVLADSGTPVKQPETTKPPEKLDDSIFLADEGGSNADLMNADTALMSEGLNLDETKGGKGKLDDLGGASKIDDIMEATKVPTGKPSEKSGADLNLDSFGSGGLLDVSIPAEDTSLGGILDEIYTSESAEVTPAAKTSPPIAAEEVIKEEEMLEMPKAPVEAVAMVAPAVEVKPDMFSNALGLALIIPLIATIFTIVFVATGFNLPSMLRAGESMMGIYNGWLIFGGLAVLSLIIIGGGALFGSMASGERKPKVKKEKPPKPPKPVKEKKEKKK